jgi:hypothetical protein
MRWLFLAAVVLAVLLLAPALARADGPITLQGDKYTEHLEYFNYREWEGHTFDFTVTIKNDTLTQRGVEKLEHLGIDRIIEERYKRL